MAIRLSKYDIMAIAIIDVIQSPSESDVPASNAIAW